MSAARARAQSPVDEGLTALELDEFVARLAADSARWGHLVRHSRDARSYELIFEDQCVNAWVICWSDGQDTGFHDHDSSTAAIAVISGRVREQRLTLGAGACDRLFGPGQRFIVPPTAIHRVLHAGGEPAVTIHAYSPPLERTGVYRSGPNGELLRESLPSDRELSA